jgi:hypothetical protein
METNKPEQIKEQEILFYDEGVKLEQMRKELEVLKVQVEHDVATDADIVSGKKTYSNAMMREVEVARRMGTMENVSALSRAIAEQERKVKLIEIEIRYISNILRLEISRNYMSKSQ